MKKWDDILVDAKPLVDFLNRKSFFDTPYNGVSTGRKVITDPKVCRDFATNQTGENFEDWQSLLTEAMNKDFEYPSFLASRITKKLGEGLFGKDFSGADLKFTDVPGTGLLINNMEGDIYRLFYCYANEKLPPLWAQVLDVYLHNGYPCGWEGTYPEGELVVFSNE